MPALTAWAPPSRQPRKALDETGMETVHRWRHSDGALWATCRTQGSRRLLELEDLGRFELDLETGEIRATATEPLPAETLERRFWKEAVPMLHQANGAIGLHASSVATRRGAVLLLGPSGVGKSSLARAWSIREGVRQLADDVSVLYGDGDGGYRLFPLPFYTNVWGPVRHEVAEPDLDVTAPDATVPVVGFVLIERDDESGPRWLDLGAENFPQLLEESWCFSLADETSRKLFFMQSLELFSSARWRRLSYPHQLTRLDESLDMLVSADFSPAS